MSVISQIVKYSEGNPGTLQFLMNLVTNAIPYSISVISFLEESPATRGTNIYVLFSDLGNKSFVRTSAICSVVPKEILEDACSRQDYSGRELLAEYENEIRERMDFITV